MTVIDGITYYDRRMLIWFSRSRYYPALISFFRLISKSGDGFTQVLLPVLLLLNSGGRHLAFIKTVAAVFCIERALYFVLKNTLKRPRPPEAIPFFSSLVKASDQFSFPSGHTMAAFVLASLFYFYFGAVAAILFVWASLVGISRVVMGVHFPTDIVAGAVLGVVIACLGFYY